MDANFVGTLGEYGILFYVLAMVIITLISALVYKEKIMENLQKQSREDALAFLEATKSATSVSETILNNQVSINELNSDDFRKIREHIAKISLLIEQMHSKLR